MIALDTNMLVRALVADHPDPVAVARRLMESDTVFISRTGCWKPNGCCAPATKRRRPICSPSSRPCWEPTTP
jgi:hypothetical protein